VGGDTAQDTLPLLKALRREGKGVLLAYSVEVDEKAAAGTQPHAVTAHKGNVQEMLRSIDFAGGFEDAMARDSRSGTSGRKSWVALKLVRSVSILSSWHRLIRILVSPNSFRNLLGKFVKVSPILSTTVPQTSATSRGGPSKRFSSPPIEAQATITAFGNGHLSPSRFFCRFERNMYEGEPKGC
jgi:hypothetical protein